MWKHSPCQKPRPFPNEQVKTKAYELWKARDGKGGSPELEDLKKAIDSLKAERSPMEWASDYTHSNIQRIWKWTGIGDKKLWDILQLLIVPMLLAVGGYYLNQQASQRQDKLADDRRKQDQQLADDRRKQDQQLAEERAKQETLNKYLDQMSELLMNKGLRKARLEDEVFVLAQSRTTTALRDLDTKRQTLLLQFLSSADLLAPKGKTGILQEAFLSDANLRGVNLRNANLQGANLRN
ncbi:pentapeptide repeat-containing protein, partial [Leptodesmis sp.]|uniref:pentapeptide repeat-containing protein n=1 Tax=Leptodesmis sp. TaxID=3100501 RepID=UPI0040535B06